MLRRKNRYQCERHSVEANAGSLNIAVNCTRYSKLAVGQTNALAFHLPVVWIRQLEHFQWVWFMEQIQLPYISQQISWEIS
jgi:hypothetical protein